MKETQLNFSGLPLDMQLGLQGIVPFKGEVNKDIASTLSIYAEEQKISHGTTALMRQKLLLNIPDTYQRDFYISPHIYEKAGRTFDTKYGYSYLDGKFGFTLYCTTDLCIDLPIATASFSQIRDLKGTNTLFAETIDNDGLFINQLQSYIYHTNRGSERQEGKDVLARYRWEQGLVSIILDYSKKQGIPVVYGQPPEFNWWSTVRENIKSANLRYNLTFEEMHFKKNKHGLWYFINSFGEPDRVSL